MFTEGTCPQRVSRFLSRSPVSLHVPRRFRPYADDSLDRVYMRTMEKLPLPFLAALLLPIQGTHALSSASAASSEVSLVETQPPLLAEVISVVLDCPLSTASSQEAKNPSIMMDSPVLVTKDASLCT